MVEWISVIGRYKEFNCVLLLLYYFLFYFFCCCSGAEEASNWTHLPNAIAALPNSATYEPYFSLILFIFVLKWSQLFSSLTAAVLTFFIFSSFLFICLWWCSGSFQSTGTSGFLHASTGSTSDPHVGHCQISWTSTQSEQPAKPFHSLQGDFYTWRLVIEIYLTSKQMQRWIKDRSQTIGTNSNHGFLLLMQCSLPHRSVQPYAKKLTPWSLVLFMWCVVCVFSQWPVSQSRIMKQKLLDNYAQNMFNLGMTKPGTWTDLETHKDSLVIHPR